MRSPGESVRVEVLGVSAFGRHGVSDAEREVGRRIVADATFTVAGCGAVRTDELADTVDYGAVAALMATTITDCSCRTLERLCGLIADAIEDRYPVAEIEVRVTKPEPPILEAIDRVAVTVRRPGRS